MTSDKFTTREVFSAHKIAMDIANRYGDMPQVTAVALGGSHSVERADAVSDIDLYVYFVEEVPDNLRYNLAVSMGEQLEINNQFWETGDEWVDVESRLHIDATFRDVTWIEEQLERVVQKHQASLGYTTALWYNVLHSQKLMDRDGWFTRLQTSVRQPYPDELCTAIIEKNYPVLRQNLSSYHYQIQLAVSRKDGVSINHRVTALLASYFDILFAVNRILHPGEKHLLSFAEIQCRRKPDNMRSHISELLELSAQGTLQVIRVVDTLLDGLDALLKAEGIRIP